MPQSRRGWTLMEMLIIITATTALSVMGAMLIYRLMDAETNAAEGLLIESRLTELAYQLRADAHAADAAEVQQADPPALLRLVLSRSAGSAVQYTCFEDRVVREAADEGDTPQRETWRLPEGESEFVVEGEPPLVRFVHRRPYDVIGTTPGGAPPSAAVREAVIEAAVGWDGRLAERRGEPR